MVVDVGGYTTDFAMLGLDLTELSSDLSGEIDGKPLLQHLSRPLGITDLDRRVQESLPETKRAAMERTIRNPDSYLLERMHSNLYGPNTRQGILGGAAIGGSPAEQLDIRRVISKFANDVADHAEEFLNAHNYDALDDLILTGGGTQIESVRTTVVTRLQHYKLQRAHCHLLTDNPPVPYRRLSKQLPRGGTAIGGASVYFDFPD